MNCEKLYIVNILLLIYLANFPSVQPSQLIGPSLEPRIIPPPPDIQPIIDRMAMYVAKNGVEFEIVVRSKNDPRFEFLQPWHSYFRYYNSKKKIFIEVHINIFHEELVKQPYTFVLVCVFNQI